jgi:hypothetical protein
MSERGRCDGNWIWVSQFWNRAGPPRHIPRTVSALPPALGPFGMIARENQMATRKKIIANEQYCCCCERLQPHTYDFRLPDGRRYDGPVCEVCRGNATEWGRFEVPK